MLMEFCRVLVLFTLFFTSFHILTVNSVEFQVGGTNGWVIPSPKNDQLYNEWASKNRFKPNDTLRFVYHKDSILVVTQEEYKKCRSTHPLFFSNNGNSIYALEQPGLHYFISGISGHCERGLKMIIKVLEPDSPPQIANQTANSSQATTSGSGGAGLERAVASSYLTFSVMLIVLLFSALLI